MSRRKYESKVLGKAQFRIAGMRTIDPKLDLGNGNSVKDLTHRAEQLQAAVSDYNSALANADAARGQIRALERGLVDQTERALGAVVARFGRDSEQYKRAGGTRKSERKRRGALQKQRAGRKGSTAPHAAPPAAHAPSLAAFVVGHASGEPAANGVVAPNGVVASNGASAPNGVASHA